MPPGLRLAAKHAVLAWVGPGRERRPRRDVGRRRRLNSLERALFRELLHVRQPAFVHPLADQPGIHAVEAEDDLDVPSKKARR